MRNKHRTFKIGIYHDGVEFTARVRGKERYLREIAFLNALTGAAPCRSARGRSILRPR